MSWWNAKYKNEHDEYEITFGSKYHEKTKIVEKVCQAIIDKVIETPEDLSPFLRGWISVKDALPEKTCRCLVVRMDSVTKTAFVDMLWYENGMWWNRLHGGNYAVTHWMPLPKPPKEEV